MMRTGPETKTTAQYWIDKINNASSDKDALSAWNELSDRDHSTDNFKMLIEVHKSTSKRLVESLT